MKPSLTEGMTELDLGMSNFDRSIDSGLDETLRQKPEQVFGRYTGWEFYALVWFANDMFHAEVWRDQSIASTISSGSLQGIMDDVSETYGHR